MTSKEASAERYARWKREGRCPNCGRAPRIGRVTCIRCSERATRQSIAAYARDPDHHNDKRMRSMYGVSLKEMRSMLAKQGGRCAVCLSDQPSRSGKKNWCLDHDHKTGRARGVLCHSCNAGMGQLRDDPALCEAAARYLRMHNGPGQTSAEPVAFPPG